MNNFIINKQINIPYLLKIGNGKIKKVGKYLFDKDMMNIALFMGEGMENILDGKLDASLNEHNINVIERKIITDIDIDAITHTSFNLPTHINAIVGVGGGKALDFAKYSAYLLKLPFISIPTSVSNDGFCSPTSSLLVGGKRKSVKSGIPFGVVVDLDIVKNSPKIFLFSGLGDMVSKVTALWDWKEAFNKGYERFNDFASLLAYNSLDLLFLKHTFDIFSPEFQRSLTNSLLTSGISMEVVGSSRPASGSEHLISHALDKLGKAQQMHGIQVGVATYLCALLQSNENIASLKSVLEATGFINFVSENPFNKGDFIEALKIAPSIKEDYYTILSEPNSFDRAISFIEKDEVLTRIIK